MKIFLAIILVINVTACSTVSGIGKDLSSTADWTKEKMGGK
jgi:predicted small secreted protein